MKLRPNSCINYPNESYARVYPWQVDMCEGNRVAATLLSFFADWHDFKLKTRDEANHKKDIGVKGEHNTDLYQYHTVKDIEDWTLYKRDAIRKAIRLLEERGIITVHQNPSPRYGFDKTLFFLFYPEKVNEWLEGYQGYSDPIRKKFHVNHMENIVDSGRCAEDRISRCAEDRARCAEDRISRCAEDRARCAEDRARCAINRQAITYRSTKDQNKDLSPLTPKGEKEKEKKENADSRKEERLKAKIEEKKEAEIKVSTNTPSLAENKIESQASDLDQKSVSNARAIAKTLGVLNVPEDGALGFNIPEEDEQNTDLDDETEAIPTQTATAIEAYEDRMKAGYQTIPEGATKSEQQFWRSKVGQFVLAKIGDTEKAIAFVEERRREMSLTDRYKSDWKREAEPHEARKNIRSKFYEDCGAADLEEAIASFLKRIAPKAEKKCDYTVHKISDEKYGEPSPEFLKCRELARQAIKKIQEENNRNQPLYGGEISLGIA